MNYEETLRYLYSMLPMFQRIGPAAYKTNLDNTLALLSAQGNPETRFRSIHIAGTNGKGSVAHLLAAVLQCAGYKTGLYTSPHLTDFRERIRINGKMIPEEQVSGYVGRYRDVITRLQPSFFEMTVGMAFEYFADQTVDIAIVETGLGGRLDSTNVILPELSIITNIGFDHMRFLGSDLPSIAGEKAGIIKAGTPVIIGQNNPETRPVFEAAARQQKAPLYSAEDEVHITDIRSNYADDCSVRFTARWPGEDTAALESPLCGNYQIENFRTVLCALHHLRTGYPAEIEPIQRGFREVKQLTGLRGRWEVLSLDPFTVADTAHNVDGLRTTLEQWMMRPATARHIVLGMVEDKDIPALLALFPKEARYYFCQPSVPRALSSERLREAGQKAGLPGKTYTSAVAALKAARDAAGPGESIFIGGSTFTVADIL